VQLLHLPTPQVTLLLGSHLYHLHFVWLQELTKSLLGLNAEWAVGFTAHHQAAGTQTVVEHSMNQ
jgi:hypothetical protein